MYHDGACSNEHVSRIAARMNIPVGSVVGVVHARQEILRDARDTVDLLLGILEDDYNRNNGNRGVAGSLGNNSNQNNHHGNLATGSAGGAGGFWQGPSTSGQGQ